MAAPRVAVVGAGLAGLAAALELHSSGVRTVLFERSRLLGGRATSFEIDGREVDNGQHVFLGCCTEFIRFVERVGMGDRLHVQDRFDALVLSRDGVAGHLRAAALPAPLHVMLSFARYPHLSIGGKLRTARALAAAMRGQNGHPSTFAAWLRQNGQDAQTLRGFWNPFFLPAFNAPFDRVAAADALFVISTAFLRNERAARFGFSTVPLAHVAAAAASRLEDVRLSTAVLGIEFSGAGATLRLTGERNEAFDAVILAVPPRHVAALLGEAQRFGVADVGGYVAFPIIDVHLWHDRGSLGFEFAALLDSPVQWIFEKEPGYLCCSMSAAGEYLSLSTAQLTERAWSEVRSALPSLRDASLARSAVTRNLEATYLRAPGEKRTSQRTSEPRLAIAGSWTDTGWPDTMESAVRSGIAAAELILQGERVA